LNIIQTLDAHNAQTPSWLEAKKREASVQVRENKQGKAEEFPSQFNNYVYKVSRFGMTTSAR